MAESWNIDLNATSTTTYTGGRYYIYWLVCSDANQNFSKPSARVDTAENVAFYAESEPKTAITVPSSVRSVLYKETNGYGESVYFDVVRLASEETNRVIRSYAFLPKKAVSKEIVTDLMFSRNVADVTISYTLTGGYVSAPSVSGAPIAANKAADSLALFWFNGLEWVKLGSDVDTANQTVSIKVRKGGKYQLRQALRSAKFAITKVYPRIFTPNGDGWNDVVNFMYEGNDKDISGKIYDINGAFVATMSAGDNESSLKWDGKNSSGKIVASGIYIYQIEADNKVINGTVVVAK